MVVLSWVSCGDRCRCVSHREEVVSIAGKDGEGGQAGSVAVVESKMV